MTGIFLFVETDGNDRTMFHGRTAPGMSPDDWEMSPQPRLQEFTETSCQILQRRVFFLTSTNCLRLTTHLVLHKADIVGVMVLMCEKKSVSPTFSITPGHTRCLWALSAHKVLSRKISNYI
jgi:hypothetical protein